jgi:hypothetical protein
MAASSSRMKNANAITFLWTDSHDESSAIGVRKAVSTTSIRLMPSSPR